MTRVPFIIIILLCAISLINGQDKRKVGLGVYLREGFSSSAQRVNPGVNYNGHSEMSTGVGFFLLIQIPKDSIGIPFRKTLKVWKSKHIKIEAGFAQRSGTFYLITGEPFQVTTGVLDLSLVVPLYFKASDGIHGYFGSGVDMSYNMNRWVVTNGSVPPPDIKKPDLSFGFVLDFGLLIGNPDSPAMILSNRFYDQLRGNYIYKEFAVTVGIFMWRRNTSI